MRLNETKPDTSLVGRCRIRTDDETVTLEHSNSNAGDGRRLLLVSERREQRE